MNGIHSGATNGSKGKTGHRVVRNAMFGVFSQVLGGGLFFLVAILVARHLGPESYGPFSFIFAFVAVIHMVADFGLTQILVREISRNKQKLDEILGAVMPLVTILAIMGICIVILSVQLLTLNADAAQAMYILGASVLVTFLAAVYGAVSRAFEQMEVNALVLVLQRIFLLILVLFALNQDAGLQGIAFCYLGERVFQWMFLYILVRRKYSRYTWRVDFTYWRYLIREGLPVGAGLVLRRISWYLDIFILSALSTASSVGLFSAAFRIIQMINVIPFTLSIPVFPVFSRLALESKDRVFAIYVRVLKVFVLISLPIATWLFILGPQITIAVFGDAYQPAGEVLQIMGPMVVFLFLNGLYVHIFSALDKQSYFMRAVGIAVTVNVVLDIALIPLWGILGAALATLISEFVLFIVGAVLLSQLGLVITYLQLFFRPMMAVLISSAALLWAAEAPSMINAILGSIGFSVLYVTAGYVLRILHEDDISTILSVLSRKPSSVIKKS